MQIHNMVDDHDVYESEVEDIFNSLINSEEDEYEEPDDNEDEDDQPEHTGELIDTDAHVETQIDEPVSEPKRGRGRPKSVHTLKVNVTDNASLPYAKKLGKAEFKDDMYTFNEFGKMDIVYKQVRNPNNELTDYYTSHCHIDGQTNTNGTPTYHTSNQLSKNYISIKLESLINEIKNGIEFSNERVFVDPFICTWKADTQKKLTTIESSLEKDLFLIYSGFDSNKIFSVTDSKIELFISNSYDGKSAILSNYTIYMVGKDSNGNERVVRDFFSIRDSKNKYLHKGIQINDIQNSLSNIDLNINSDIKIMKKIKLKPEEINEIATKFQKSKAKQIRQRCESLPPEYNNMYYILLVVSSMLNEDYKASEHFNVQPVVNKIIKRAFEKHEREMKKAEAASSK